jgi:hypothetical protein
VDEAADAVANHFHDDAPTVCSGTRHVAAPMSTATLTQPGSELRAYAWRPVAVVALITAAAHLVIATRYGWHRDELYYSEAGRHLAFGYVDQPPLTPSTPPRCPGCSRASSTIPDRQSADAEERRCRRPHLRDDL